MWKLTLGYGSPLYMRQMKKNSEDLQTCLSNKLQILSKWKTLHKP
jgi:hypothetical protein